MADMPHAVIDLDDLSNVFPQPRRSFAGENLQAIWPNYAAIPHLKVVIPSVIADQLAREQFRAATPGARFLVCELLDARFNRSDPVIRINAYTLEERHKRAQRLC